MPPDDRPLQPGVRIGAVGEQQLHDVGRIELVHQLGRRPAQHRPERVHVDGGVQRRRPGAVGHVRIGALVDQHGGGIEVRVDDGEHQRRGAVGILQVQVGLLVGEHADGADGAVAGGIHQGVQPPRGSTVTTIPDVSNLNSGKVSCFDLAFLSAPSSTSALHRLGIVLRSRPHQRRLSLPLLGGVDLGAAGDERPDHAVVAGPRRRHQDGLALGSGGVGIGAGLQQQVGQRRVAVLRRQLQRRDPVPAGRLDVRTRLHQQLRGRLVVAEDGIVQRGHAVGLGRVDVGALRDQALRTAVRLPCLDRVDQANGIAAGGFETGHRDGREQHRTA